MRFWDLQLSGGIHDVGVYPHPQVGLKSWACAEKKETVRHSSLALGSGPGRVTMPENPLPPTHHLYQSWAFFPQVLLVVQLFEVYTWQLAKRKKRVKMS